MQITLHKKRTIQRKDYIIKKLYRGEIYRKRLYGKELYRGEITIYKEATI